MGDTTTTEVLTQVGVLYCALHHGIANEDSRRCDWADDEVFDDDGDPVPCDLRQCFIKGTLDES